VTLNGQECSIIEVGWWFLCHGQALVCCALCKRDRCREPQEKTCYETGNKQMFFRYVLAYAHGSTSLAGRMDLANRNFIFSWIGILGCVLGLLVSPGKLQARDVAQYMGSASVEHSVSRARGLIEKGRSLLKRGGIETACISFRQATIALPTWWIARFEYVRCARLLGAPYEELVGHLQVALEADPGKAALHHLLGVVHEDHGASDLAVRAYRKAAEISPWMAEVHVRLGLIAMRDKRLPEAEKAFLSALEHTPESIIVRNHLSDIYIATGRNKKAIVHLRAVLAVTRYPGPTLARLARLYGELGMSADKQRVLRRLQTQ
jgi:tetratricopeptide (TPR) repeat protein